MGEAPCLSLGPPLAHGAAGQAVSTGASRETGPRAGNTSDWTVFLGDQL